MERRLVIVSTREDTAERTDINKIHPAYNLYPSANHNAILNIYINRYDLILIKPYLKDIERVQHF